MSDTGATAGALSGEASDEDAAYAAVVVGLRRGLMLAEVARAHGRPDRARGHIHGILTDLAPELAALGLCVRVL